MEKERVQGYVASLEQIIMCTHLDLEETMSAFQDMCLRVTPKRVVPTRVISDIREAYKEIQDQLTKIRGIDQLLRSKYKQYHQRDTPSSGEIMEFAFLAKSLYLKFENTLQAIEANRRLRDKGEHSETYGPRISLRWFHSRVNQVLLARNLRSLYELDYKNRCDLKSGQRREVIRNGMRSVSLFALSGEVGLIDVLHSRVQLREYDIKERYSGNEFRGALTHLREISPSEVERVIRRFTDSRDFLKLKCVFMPIQSQKDLARAVLNSPEKVLELLTQGEVRIFPI